MRITDSVVGTERARALLRRAIRAAEMAGKWRVSCAISAPRRALSDLWISRARAISSPHSYSRRGEQYGAERPAPPCRPGREATGSGASTWGMAAGASTSPSASPPCSRGWRPTRSPATSTLVSIAHARPSHAKALGHVEVPGPGDAVARTWWPRPPWRPRASSARSPGSARSRWAPPPTRGDLRLRGFRPWWSSWTRATSKVAAPRSSRRCSRCADGPLSAARRRSTPFIFSSRSGVSGRAGGRPDRLPRDDVDGAACSAPVAGRHAPAPAAGPVAGPRASMNSLTRFPRSPLDAGGDSRPPRRPRSDHALRVVLELEHDPRPAIRDAVEGHFTPALSCASPRFSPVSHARRPASAR